MNNKRMMLYIAGTVLLSLFTMGVAALQSQAATKPSQSYTEYFIGGSLTPVFTPSTATPTLKDFTPSLPLYRFPTSYSGPTVTASGSLVAQNETLLRALYERIPPTIAGFKTITYEADQYFDGGMAEFLLDDTSGVQYTVQFHAELSVQDAYLDYLSRVNQMFDGRQVQVGDQAFLNPRGPTFIAVMQYRNISMYVGSATYSGNIATPTTPLSEEQLAQILQDLFAWVSGTERF